MTSTTNGPTTPAARATGERSLPPRPPRATGPAAPPPRPDTASVLVAPGAVIPPEPERPRAIRLAVALGWAAAALGALGVVAAVLDRESVTAELTALATATDPDAAADVVADGVRATMVLVLGGTVLVLGLVALWTALVRSGRGWARWVLLATALPTLLVIDIAQSVVSGGAEADRYALIGSAGLLVLALVPLLARSARAWFRAPAG
ncbi:hypothetical protein [Blastococcus sp. SYSU D00820]